MGLAPFVAAYTWKAARNRDEETARIARFWTKIFAINFAAGVVTGIPMEFQFGTNWAAFSRRSGAVVGQPLAMESMFAFFLESVFLAMLLYRRRAAAHDVYGLVGGAGLCSARGSPASSSLQPTRGCSIPSAMQSTLTARSASKASGPCSPHRFCIWQFLHVLNGGAARRRIHRHGRRRILPVVAPRRSDRAAFRASRRHRRLDLLAAGDLPDRRPQR